MGKITTPPRDGRTTIRLNELTLKRVGTLASNSGRTLSTMVNTLLMEATGTASAHPCIVKSGSQYVWVSPNGLYGQVDKTIWKRFLGGGLPIEGDDRWDESFDSMEQACKALGKEVCKQTYGGLVVKDVTSFVKICQEYGNK